MPRRLGLVAVRQAAVGTTKAVVDVTSPSQPRPSRADCQTRLHLQVAPSVAACSAGVRVFAYAIGLVVFRGRTESGPYVALITLALSLFVFQVANTWNSMTGGYKGLKGNLQHADGRAPSPARNRDARRCPCLEAHSARHSPAGRGAE